MDRLCWGGTRSRALRRRVVDSVSWRLVFLINLPLAALALWLTRRHVPEGLPSEEGEPLDVGGAVLIAAALGGTVLP